MLDFFPCSSRSAGRCSKTVLSGLWSKRKPSWKFRNNGYLFCFSGIYPPKHVTAARERSQDSSRQPARSGSIPALLPKPPLTPLVKLVGKVYSLKCRSGRSALQPPLHRSPGVKPSETSVLSLLQVLRRGVRGSSVHPGAVDRTPAETHPDAGLQGQRVSARCTSASPGPRPTGGRLIRHASVAVKGAASFKKDAVSVGEEQEQPSGSLSVQQEAPRS